MPICRGRAEPSPFMPSLSAPCPLLPARPPARPQMGVRYRRWRNSVQGGAAAEPVAEEEAAAAEGEGEGISASRQELFRIEDDASTYVDAEPQQQSK